MAFPLNVDKLDMDRDLTCLSTPNHKCLTIMVNVMVAWIILQKKLVAKDRHLNKNKLHTAGFSAETFNGYCSMHHSIA